MKKNINFLIFTGLLIFAIFSFIGCESKCTITFESNGGTIIQSITANKGESISEPTNPTKSGFTFVGWYEDSDLSGDKILFPYTIKNDIVFFAKWADNNKGKREFEFTPKYNGNYTFLSENSLVMFDIEGVSISNRIGDSVELEGGRQYFIKFYSENGLDLGEFHFDTKFNTEKLYPEVSKTITVESFKYEIFEFVSEGLPYRIKTSDELMIEVLDRNLDYIYDIDFTRNRVFVGEQGIVSTIFLDKNYFIKITNRTSSQISCDIKVSEPTELKLNQADSLNLDYYADTYYSFTPKFSGNYLFSSTGNDRLSLFNSDFYMLKNVSQKSLSYYLDEGREYFFKLNKGFNTASEQKIVFSPAAISFGDNLVENDAECRFFAFTANLNGNFKFSTTDTDIIFSIYDINLELVINNLSSYIKLNENTKYFVRIDNAKKGTVIDFNISLETSVVDLNEPYNFVFDGEYINLEFTPAASGNYNFGSDNVLELKLYEGRYLFSMDGITNLTAGNKYYINLKGNPSSQIYFNIIFSPTMIELNSHRTVTENGECYMYISESNNPANIYTYGTITQKVEITIYNSSFVEIDRFSSEGQANFQYEFDSGKKYFLKVNILLGPNLLILVVEDLSIIKDYLKIEETVQMRLEIGSDSSQILKFCPNKDRNYEIKFDTPYDEDFVFSFYDGNGEEIAYEYEFRADSIYFYKFTCHFEMGKEYFIKISNASNQVQYGYLTVVVPITNANLEIYLDGEWKKDWNSLTKGTEEGDRGYCFKITPDEGASPFILKNSKVKIVNDVSGSIWYKVDGHYIFLFIPKEASENSTFILRINLDDMEMTFILNIN